MAGRVRHRGAHEVPADEDLADGSAPQPLTHDVPPWPTEVRDDREQSPGQGTSGLRATTLVAVMALGAAGVGVAIACLAIVVNLVVSVPRTGTPPGSSSSGGPPNAAGLARSVTPALVDVDTVIASAGL